MQSRSLQQAIDNEHEGSIIRTAKLIRDWRPLRERDEPARALVRLAMRETGSRVSEETRYQVYSILSFVMPDDAWRVGEQVPDELLDEQAAWEIEHQQQLEQRSCPECGDGVCPTDS